MRPISPKTNLTDKVNDFEFNNRWSEQENAVLDSNQTLDSSKNNQQSISQTIKGMISQSFRDEGTTNDIRLHSSGDSLIVPNPTGHFQMPDDWFDGMRFKFNIAETNIGITFVSFLKNDNTYSTQKELVNTSGNSLVSNEIVSGTEIEVVYVLDIDKCRLTPWSEAVEIKPARKNAIINGKMEISQRYPYDDVTPNIVQPANGQYTLDRWQYKKEGLMEHEVQKVKRENISGDTSNLPEDLTVENFLKATVVSPSGTLAADHNCYFQQNIEGYNFLPFKGNLGTLSFWIRVPVAAPSGGIPRYAVSFGNYGDGVTPVPTWSYVYEFPIPLANKFYKITTTILFDEFTSGWNFEKEAGLRVRFMLASGTDFYAISANQWENGDHLSNGNPVNITNTNGYEFYLSNVQLELGVVATSFEYRTHQEELNLCERYFQKSYEEALKPGDTNPAPSGAVYFLSIGAGNTSGHVIFPVEYKTRLRDNLTPILYNPDDGTSPPINYTVPEAGENGFIVDNGVAGDTANKTIRFHYSVDAEII